MTAKTEEIAVAKVPDSAPVADSEGTTEPPLAVQQLTGGVFVAPLLQPPNDELYVPPVIREGHDWEERTNGKGAMFDAPDVRFHVVNSLGRHPKLLSAYLNSSIE